MKRIFVITLLITSSLIWAQDSTNIKVETPRILANLSYGGIQKFKDVEIRFVEVVQDSRCPKAVTCVWAGEVIVLVDIFRSGETVEQKKLTLSATSHLQNQIGNIISTENLKIGGFNVLPYPVSGSKIKKEDYVLQLDVRGN